MDISQVLVCIFIITTKFLYPGSQIPTSANLKKENRGKSSSPSHLKELNKTKQDTELFKVF